MSRPFAAKGSGACLKRVLNTRLTPASPRQRRDVDGQRPGFGADVHQRSQVMRLSRHSIGDPIGEGDPLPPPDDVIGPGRDPLAALYRDQQPGLLRLLARSTSAEAAPDLCQQAFLQIGQSAQGRAISNPAAYLRRIARNLATDHLQARLRRRAHAEVPVEAVTLTAPDQIAGLEARDMLRRLEAALARLKPRTREIFLAHRLDGYSYREIAARTGLSVKAVEKHMSRAIAHLDRLDTCR